MDDKTAYGVRGSSLQRPDPIGTGGWLRSRRACPQRGGAHRNAEEVRQCREAINAYASIDSTTDKVITETAVLTTTAVPASAWPHSYRSAKR